MRTREGVCVCVCVCVRERERERERERLTKMDDICTHIIEKVLVVRYNKKGLLPRLQVAVVISQEIQVRQVGYYW